MMQKYDFKTIEQTAQAFWDKQQTFKVVEDTSKEKYYCLSMFPYPSGKLHMGHVRNYSIGDVLSRYYKMKGLNVLQPMGWDAFGLPAENAAISNQTAPATWTYANIEYMKQQLKSLGFGYDWSRELATCTPEYYKFEQELFIKLHKKGLVYQQKTEVNWDPVDNTVLANEQVIDGKGWRSGAAVEKRLIDGWFLKITNYAEELLQNLEILTGWPESVRTMQSHWIGKSVGIEIDFHCHNTTLTVYTTRPDTIMGVTYLAIAPEHPLALKASQSNTDIQQFIKVCRAMSTDEASLETMEKKGINSGLKAVHPLTGEEVDIWIANFVLMSYGTGAVMSVPAHDERDYVFAKKYHIPIKQVINCEADISKSAYTKRGILCNSGEFDGLDFESSFTAIHTKLCELQAGRKRTNYRLRDWGVSRQRYWGCPIPVIHCDDCGSVMEKIENLPVKLPEDVVLDGTQSPLHTISEFLQTTCPRCNKPAKRSTDTFDTFFESSWYFARYTCPDSDTMTDKRSKYWLNNGVDQYVGGVEHAILHLLYARFFNKLMRDEGLLSNDEPFRNLLTQGMVLKDGAKMSKSRGNTVDPKEMIDTYGADTVRLFILFAAPPTQDLEWNEGGLEGAHRFIIKVIKLCSNLSYTTGSFNNLSKVAKQLRYKTHTTLVKVCDDIERRHSFNTAVAALMELSNTMIKYPHIGKNADVSFSEAVRVMLLCIAPFTPHIAHHLAKNIGLSNNIMDEALPEVDKSALIQDLLEIIVQVNGKLRAKLAVSADNSIKSLETLALADTRVTKFTQDKEIVKVIVVPDKLVNVVVK